MNNITEEITKERLCQIILDAQGYLVVAGWEDYSVGRVLKEFYVGGGEYIDSKCTILGKATVDDFRRQYDNYRHLGPKPIPEYRDDYPYFHKIVAE